MKINFNNKNIPIIHEQSNTISYIKSRESDKCIKFIPIKTENYKIIETLKDGD